MRIEQAWWDPDKYCIKEIPNEAISDAFWDKCREMDGRTNTSSSFIDRHGKRQFIPVDLVLSSLELAETMVEWIEAAIVMNKLVN